MKILSLLFLALCVNFLNYAQTASETSWITNGRVYNMTRGDGKLFLSGDFNWVGEPYNSKMAVLDGSLGVVEGYPNIENGIDNAISDDNGGWYAISYGTILHIKANKSIEELPVTFQGSVYTIEKADNILYIGGSFTSVNDVPQKYAAAIDLTTNSITDWNPNPESYISCLKADDGVVYIGGHFTSVGGQTRSNIAATDANTGGVTAWNANVSTAFGYVFTIAVDADNVYFGGSFINVASASPARTKFAAVDKVTGALSSFNPQPNGTVGKLLVDNNTIYISGNYSYISGIYKPGLAAFDLTTGLLTEFNAVFENIFYFYGNGPISSMAIDGQKLFLAGDFPGINGVDQPYLAVLDKLTGTLLATEDREISHSLNALAISDGKVLIGAYDLYGITGILTPSLCFALDEATDEGTKWQPEIPDIPGDGYIDNIELHYQGNQVYYLQNATADADDGGGYYTFANVGAVNTTNGDAIGSLALYVQGNVQAWAFSEDVLYLAGDFNRINTTTTEEARDGFAAIDLTTGELITFTPPYFNGYATYSMVVSNNVLYAGGDFSFTTDGGTEYSKLAAWDATSGELLPWTPPLLDLADYERPTVGAVYDSKVYITGSALLRVDAITGEADDWNPAIGDDYFRINSILIQDTLAIIAGEFSPGLLVVNLESGEPTAWQPSIEDVYDGEGSINSIAASSTKLYVGGNFYYEVNGKGRQYFAEYLLPINSTIINSPPVIASTVKSVPIQGIVTIPLATLISDPEDNVDFSSLEIILQPASGALAEITNTILTINYSGFSFTGPDKITIGVCDLLGSCTQQELTIEVVGDLMIYSGISPNGDAFNEKWIIQNIETLPDTKDNKVSIYNRWGDLIFETENYDNDTKVFTGKNRNGNEIPSGIYFYKVEFASGKKPLSGYLTVVR